MRRTGRRWGTPENGGGRGCGVEIQQVGGRDGRASRALPSGRPVIAALAVLAVLAAFAAAQQARAQATEPERMKGVEVLAGDQRVHLFWDEPDDGGSPLLRYEYRYRSTGDFPATWTEVPDGLDIPVIGGDLPPIRYLLPDRFANGTAYTFQMRAVNAVGAGEVDEDSEATATPAANNPASGMVRLFNEERPQGELRPGGRVILRVDHGQGNLLVQDADGLSHAAVGRDAEEYFRFRHYWYRVEGGTETLVEEDTFGPGLEGGYQFTDADVGARFRVVTRFIDDRGNPEEVSAEYPPSGTILPAAECGAPAHSGGATRIWTGMLRVRAFQRWRDDNRLRHQQRLHIRRNRTRVHRRRQRLHGRRRLPGGRGADAEHAGLQPDLGARRGRPASAHPACLRRGIPLRRGDRGVRPAPLSLGQRPGLVHARLPHPLSELRRRGPHADGRGAEGGRADPDVQRGAGRGFGAAAGRLLGDGERRGSRLRRRRRRRDRRPDGDPDIRQTPPLRAPG